MSVWRWWHLFVCLFVLLFFMFGGGGIFLFACLIIFYVGLFPVLFVLLVCYYFPVVSKILKVPMARKHPTASGPLGRLLSVACWVSRCFGSLHHCRASHVNCMQRNKTLKQTSI